MPIITHHDGKTTRVPYEKAVSIKQFLDDPMKLAEIENVEEREKKRKYMQSIQDISFADISKPIRKTYKPKLNNQDVQRVINDKSLRGKDKFYAIGRAMGIYSDEKAIDKTEQL